MRGVGYRVTLEDNKDHMNEELRVFGVFFKTDKGNVPEKIQVGEILATFALTSRKRMPIFTVSIQHRDLSQHSQKKMIRNNRIYPQKIRIT